MQKSPDWGRPNVRKPYISLQTEDNKENIIETMPKLMQTGINQLNATHYLQGLPKCSATFQSACAGKLHAWSGVPGQSCPREAACCLLLVTSKGEETMVWARCLLQEATCCLLPVKSRGEETMGWAWCLLQKATCCLLPAMSKGEETMGWALCLLQEAACCLLPVMSRGEETMGWAWCLLQRGCMLCATSHVMRRKNNEKWFFFLQ